MSQKRPLWRLEGSDVYPVSIEGHYCLIVVDLSVAKDAPVEGERYCHSVTMTLNDPHGNGLPKEDELKKLDILRESVVPMIEKDIMGRHVARITGRGQIELHFYGRKAEVSPDVINSVMERFPNHEFTGGYEDDPEWDKYFSCFYPNFMGFQYILLRRTLEESPEVPTSDVTVTHYLYFESSKERDKYVRALKGTRFDISRDEFLPPNQIGSGYRLRLSDSRRPAVEEINSGLEHVIDLTSQVGGEYCHFEFSPDEGVQYHLSNDALLQIAAEVIGGVRPKSDLKRFEIELGEPESIKREDLLGGLEE